MKKYLLSIIVFTFVFFPFEGHAHEENMKQIIYIALNDELISFEDAYPEVVNGITYIPVRFFAERMGAEVTWDHASQSVWLTKEGRRIILDLDSRMLITDGGIMVFDSIYIKNNRIMAPFKLIAKSFDYDVSYISEGPLARAMDSQAKIIDEVLYEHLKQELIKEKERMILAIRNKEREELRLRYKIAYLTFDDGPTIYTEKFLQILNKYNAKATFFMLSSRIQNYSEVVKKVVEEGNAVGLHGVTHDVKKIYKTPEMLISEMNQCNTSLHTVVGIRSKLIRVPYGSKPHMTEKHRKEVLRVGYKMWDWNVDSKDSLGDYVAPAMIIENVKEQVSRRATNVPIILLHERRSTVEALPEILEYLKKEGYVLLPIDENQKPFSFWEDMY